jgi:hypothetical protein
MAASSSLPPWNAVRLDLGRPGVRDHVESYFLKLNDPEGRQALWVKATLLARRSSPREVVAEAWAIAFDRAAGHLAAKRTVLASEARFSPLGLDVSVGGLELREGRVVGEVSSGGVTFSLDLRYEPLLPALVPFPYPSMYTGPLPGSKLVSPCPDAVFDGTYRVNGREVSVSGWRGMQGHNWGKSHAYRYAWAHCNVFDGEPDLVFEGLTGQVKVGPAIAPPLTVLCVRHRGVRYDWTRLRDIAASRGRTDGLRWAFEGASDIGRIEGELWGDPADFVGLRYDNPSGPTTHCLNSKIARARLRFTPGGRGPIVVESHAAALEIGTTDPGHGVRMYV